jgi:hypothetical protein
MGNATDPAEPQTDPLRLVLARVVSDPEQTRYLHKILGPFCHESRNILNGLKMSLYLAVRCGEVPAVTWDAMERRYVAVEQIIDRVHQICRPAPLYPVRLPLDLLFKDHVSCWSRVLAAAGRRLAFEPPAEPVVAAFDPNRLELALDDLVRWRAACGRRGTVAKLGWATERGSAVIRWTECDAPEGAPVLEPSAQRGGRRQPGLTDADPDPAREGPDLLDLFALPFVTRVLAAHGGTVESSDQDGWQLHMRWPLESATRRETPHEVQHHPPMPHSDAAGAKPVHPARRRPRTEPSEASDGG